MPIVRRACRVRMLAHRSSPPHAHAPIRVSRRSRSRKRHYRLSGGNARDRAAQGTPVSWAAMTARTHDRWAATRRAGRVLGHLFRREGIGGRQCATQSSPPPDSEHGRGSHRAGVKAIVPIRARCTVGDDEPGAAVGRERPVSSRGRGGRTGLGRHRNDRPGRGRIRPRSVSISLAWLVATGRLPAEGGDHLGGELLHRGVIVGHTRDVDQHVVDPGIDVGPDDLGDLGRGADVYALAVLLQRH